MHEMGQVHTSWVVSKMHLMGHVHTVEGWVNAWDGTQLSVELVNYTCTCPCHRCTVWVLRWLALHTLNSTLTTLTTLTNSSTRKNSWKIVLNLLDQHILLTSTDAQIVQMKTKHSPCSTQELCMVYDYAWTVSVVMNPENNSTQLSTNQLQWVPELGWWCTRSDVLKKQSRSVINILYYSLCNNNIMLFQSADLNKTDMSKLQLYYTYNYDTQKVWKTWLLAHCTWCS